MNNIDKFSLNVLKSISKEDNIHYSKLLKKYKNANQLNESICYLCEQNYTDYSKNIPNSTFKITRLGSIVVETSVLLTPKYILTQIFVPIAIGVSSSIVSMIIIKLLGF